MEFIVSSREIFAPVGCGQHFFENRILLNQCPLAWTQSCDLAGNLLCIRVLTGAWETELSSDNVVGPRSFRRERGRTRALSRRHSSLFVSSVIDLIWGFVQDTVKNKLIPFLCGFWWGGPEKAG